MCHQENSGIAIGINETVGYTTIAIVNGIVIDTLSIYFFYFFYTLFHFCISETVGYTTIAIVNGIAIHGNTFHLILF